MRFIIIIIIKALIKLGVLMGEAETRGGRLNRDTHMNYYALNYFILFLFFSLFFIKKMSDENEYAYI